MANITRENIGQLHDKIKVKISKEDYLPGFEKTLKSYAKNANIPGFRKGMVPMGMLKKMYGQEIFRNEVLNAAGKNIEDFINEEKLEIFAQPMVMPNESPLEIDMNRAEDFEFDFEIGLRPEFSIPDLSQANLTRYRVNVSDQLLEDETQRIQKRYGNVEEMKKVSSKDDIINATIVRTNETGAANEGAEPTEIRFVLETLPAKLKEEWKDAELGTTK